MIVLCDDELTNLEQELGPDVRRMGPWNTDGVFGYASIPVAAVEKAAENLNNPNAKEAVAALRRSTEPSRALVELLRSAGPSLVERIVANQRGESR